MGWLLLGSALLVAGSPSGRWTVAVAAWLAPVFVIRFVRHEALDTLFKEFADGHAVTIYGEPSPQLVAIAKGLQGVTIRWYSFLQGLEAGRDRELPVTGRPAWA